ncbi:hypothetical protein B0O99DRAFT_516762 [Bisporella sp. PMI_857]|nr:hypothetical protein B0O99DRAFT_516762 [Bisporella sp. PMI_857]
MAEVLGVVASVYSISAVVGKVVLSYTYRAIHLSRLYGIPAGVILLFGSRTTWRMQAEVLGKLNKEDAMAFKKSVQDESTMISVAAAIIAQIGITGLSLADLSRTHWVARGSFLFSLTSALMAVYYATSQHRTMGRLLKENQVRQWIRGETSDLEKDRRMRFLYGPRQSPSDPAEFEPRSLDRLYMKQAIIRQCFLPGVASVVSISAPQMLLSASLGALLIGLGIYIGVTWIRDLDVEAGVHDSRNVFITYITTLSVCILVYSISTLIQDNDDVTEDMIIDRYLNDFMANNPDILSRRQVQILQEGSNTFQIIPVDTRQGGSDGTAMHGDTGDSAVEDAAITPPNNPLRRMARIWNRSSFITSRPSLRKECTCSHGF